ncbi:MAG: J domain-containing protein [Oscillospiraceae bacterium]|nr:J domain-containing protein [Oscillospiraceae bacterium]
MSWPWDALGLPGPAELSVIRQAYAQQLKRTRPDENPEGFQRLREAYQAARRLARGEGEARRDPDGGAGENREAVREETWDFERLFAEGEADERGRRFQKLWELRLENQSRYDAWRPPPPRRLAEAALDWMAISHALSLMEELAGSGADDALWSSFCKSQLFLYVQRRPDFVFALEDFLRKWPEIPQAACDALFRAYRFDAPTVAPEYAPLRELLKARIPEAVWTRPPMIWRSLFGLLAALLAAFALNFRADFLATQEIRAEQVRDWLYEDFGREFVRVERRPASPFAWLDTETETYFLAAWDGPRDMEQGKKGYASNYAEARMAREIAAFAERWHYTLSPPYENAPRGDWRVSYLQIPLTGAGEGILALGDTLSAMRDEDWYKRSPPDCRLYLGWENWSFYEYDAQTGEFNAPALRDYYERFFGADLCRIALRSTGVARADMGNAFLLTPESGTVRVENRDFFQVTGIENPGGRPLRRYFLSDDGAELFCVPAYRKVSELTLQEFYSMDKKEYALKGFSEPLTVFHSAPDR